MTQILRKEFHKPKVSSNMPNMQNFRHSYILSCPGLTHTYTTQRNIAEPIIYETEYDIS